eukprot:UN1822
MRGSMTLNFLTADGCEREVVVAHTPLGLDLRKEMPLRVRTVRPNSAGMELKIEAGWVVTKVNGESIQDLPFPAAYDKLKKGLQSVPAA